LEFLVLKSPNGFTLACDYSTELFEGATITSWLEGIAALLESALADPAQTCATLPLMPAAVRERLLVEWNKTEKPQPAMTVLDLIVEQSEIQHEQTAVQFGENSLTYGQLLARTDEIVAALHARGVGQGDQVGILMRRSLDLLPALLATWRLNA